MSNILTIVAKDKNLQDSNVNKIFMSLEKNKARIENFKWLKVNQALDIYFTDINVSKVKEIILPISLDWQLDYMVHDNDENRKKKLLIADMDSTMIEQECIDEIADKLGLKDKISDITEKAMNGELDFNQALEERVSLLKGLDESELQLVYDNQITISKGADKLLATMDKNNVYCILVSGGFTFFASRVADKLGFNEYRANNLLIEDNKLSGKVSYPILDKNAKYDILQELMAKLNINAYNVVAIGDGANDLPMLKAANMGVAYKAKDAVREQVNCQINFTDLESILFFQGYTEQEIIL